MKEDKTKVKRWSQFINESEKTHIDLFDAYNEQPTELKELLAEYESKLIDGMHYDELAELLVKVNNLGYTFDYGLDAQPYGLRPLGVELTQLKGF